MSLHCRAPLALVLTAALLTGASSVGVAQQPPSPTAPPVAGTNGADLPLDYIIGPDDVLTVIFWREKDLSADVQVRPDGRITLPLLNDIQAAGVTPEELRARLAEAAGKFLEAPTVSVVVKQINSRKVFVTGEIVKPGAYPLTGPLTVVQMLAIAGGLSEFADEEKISVVRTENGKSINHRFNYKDVKRSRRMEQNILLKPGDTIIVP